jgi:receptor protein-tyrosine kinase
MNLIEEATKRLQELEKAGIRVPSGQPGNAGKAEPRASAEPIPQQVARAAVQALPRAQAPAESPVDKRLEPVLQDKVPDARNYRNIDLARLQASGFITPAVRESKLLHEFRVIKRPLIQNALGKAAGPVANGNLIMVTSALPGEGKSFVSLNLAMSIALEVDCRVLLVDADVIKPTIPQLLGIQRAKGLMDVLTEPDLSFGDVLLRTNVERLTLTLAGTPHRGASELLASEAMTRLLQEISGRYRDRIVIFDSPPLLATTESRVLASRMGQVVVVVEAEKTTHGVLESALSTVESCPVVLSLLNKARESDGGSYYGYYGYGG